VTTTEVAKAPKRGRETAWDMARSLGLILVITAITLVFVPDLFHPGKSDRFAAVNYSEYVAGFRQVTGRPALVPDGLPTGWASNAGSLTGPAAAEHLHIGWGVPGAKYAGLEESVAPMAAFVSQSSVLGPQGAKVTGSTPIAGVQWQTRVSTRGEYSLSRTVDGVAVVITGSATKAQLQTLAALLQPARSGTASG
jgi:hypothetical protein